jgi:hypothetical protein
LFEKKKFKAREKVNHYLLSQCVKFMQFHVGFCDENFMITRLHFRDLTNHLNELLIKIISFIRGIECNILLSM